jgi:hypothetical protein
MSVLPVAWISPKWHWDKFKVIVGVRSSGFDKSKVALDVKLHHEMV